MDKKIFISIIGNQIAASETFDTATRQLHEMVHQELVRHMNVTAEHMEDRLNLRIRSINVKLEK